MLSFTNWSFIEKHYKRIKQILNINLMKEVQMNESELSSRKDEF